MASGWLSPMIIASRKAGSEDRAWLPDHPKYKQGSAVESAAQSQKGKHPGAPMSAWVGISRAMMCCNSKEQNIGKEHAFPHHPSVPGGTQARPLSSRVPSSSLCQLIFYPRTLQLLGRWCDTAPPHCQCSHLCSQASCLERTIHLPCWFHDVLATEKFTYFSFKHVQALFRQTSVVQTPRPQVCLDI